MSTDTNTRPEYEYEPEDTHIVVTLVRDHKVIAFAIATAIISVVSAILFTLIGFPIVAALTIVWGIIMVALAVVFGVIPIMALDFIARE